LSALVVKIGGSLWRAKALAQWIAALRAYPHTLTLVPGGGPFADTVRATQARIGFSDAAAHEMALLAMEQYGLALIGAFAGLEAAATPQEAAASHAQGKIAVWRPSAMTLASDVPARWNVTSDSLAAWFARRSGAVRLLLVKSVELSAAHSPQSLVDPCFAAYAAGLEVFIAGPDSVENAAEAFGRGDVPGARANFAAQS
jgi:aspartokinase-like uncharacterized kinase